MVAGVDGVVWWREMLPSSPGCALNVFCCLGRGETASCLIDTYQVFAWLLSRFGLHGRLLYLYFVVFRTVSWAVFATNRAGSTRDDEAKVALFVFVSTVFPCLLRLTDSMGVARPPSAQRTAVLRPGSITAQQHLLHCSTAAQQDFGCVQYEY